LVERYRAENRVIFIDFTARWCATCQTNSKLAIETTEVSQFIRENGIAPLLADWSEPSEVIEENLKKLGRNSIPLIVIWVPGHDQPMLIDGLVTKAKVLSALDFAVKNAK
ncbi:MAG: thioredoxin family protein, partial [Planctomycetia bacterium]|nr:thioredoxin family protein [Planctomycetia bacterium]